jgi:osmotically-inducible protein OsmY
MNSSLQKTLAGALALAAVALAGCAPILIGGAAAGASMVHDRRTAGTSLEDQNIELKASNIKGSDAELRDLTNISATSYNLTLLLTGQAARPELKERYLQKIREIERVARIVEDIQIAPLASLTEKSQDAYTTSKVKLNLLDIQIAGFDPTRIKVVTERGVVYLMGLVTREEETAVVHKIRYIQGVQRVVKAFEYL